MDRIQQLIESRPGFVDMQPAHQLDAIQIADNIWMSSGTSNAYMVVTEAGRVIINTGMGFESLTHKRVFDAVYEGSTPYIVLTQGHVDHVGGVKHFRTPDTLLITQQNNFLCQHDDMRIQKIRSSQAYIWFQKTIDSAIAVAKTNPEMLVQDKPKPDITFDQIYTFSCGGIDFDLLATPGGETVDSCVVWLPQQKTLFSGNLFGPLFPHFPNINTVRGDKYRYIEPYIESLRRVRLLGPEILITGHFEPIVGKELIRECLDRLEAAVTFVHTETLKGMNAGKDIFTLMREVVLPEHLRVGEGYGKVSWAVRTIWESYMGWFKGQSTSELYATQPKDIYADLVELAGINAVIQRAQQKLDSGDIESALLLAEAAMVADKKNQTAQQLSLAVHEALLARSGGSNFWETGWIKQQIALLQKQMLQKQTSQEAHDNG
jgi:alkyl sulfatase BDS1-like metallo-beta-lactamase superfamily hydrolase